MNNTVCAWWNFVKAGAELDGDDLKPDDVILHYSGNGSSLRVTVQDLDDHCQDVHDDMRTMSDLVTVIDQMMVYAGSMYDIDWQLVNDSLIKARKVVSDG